MSKRKPPPTIPVGVIHCEGSKQVDITYGLSAVLCIYGTPEDRGNQISMLHQVDRGAMGPGKPIDPVSFAKSIYRLKKGEMVEKLEFRGEHVLAENRDAILWWRPAAVTPMWFKTASPVPRLTALNGVPIPQPPLVFRANKRGHGLQVWALVANQRPSEDTQLYYAPYMNCSGDGFVCMGTARDPSLNNIKKTIPADWERLFFDSNFSHTPPPLNYGHSEKKPIDGIEDRPAKLEAYAKFLDKIRKRSGSSESIFATALIPTKRTVRSVL